MNIFHISDTHNLHESIIIPENTDIIIHSGDASNLRNPALNIFEMEKFIEWYSSLKVKHKVYVAGNHDTSLERYPFMKNNLERGGIHYLFNSMIEIEGISIWGSPFTVNFHNWAFMKSREIINRIWQNIPQELDILVTHGPPKYILDLTFDEFNSLQAVGDSALSKAISSRKINYHLFGHIHSNKKIINTGTRFINGTTYINSAAVLDGAFDKGIIYNGTFFTINKQL